MKMHAEKRITGIFYSLNPSLLRVVVRRSGECNELQFNVFKFADKIEVVAKAIWLLSQEVGNFIPSLLRIDEENRAQTPQRKRLYAHTDRQKLYDPDRNDLREKHAKLFGKLWIDTNIDEDCMRKILEEAKFAVSECKPTGFEFCEFDDANWKQLPSVVLEPPRLLRRRLPYKVSSDTMHPT